MKNQRVSEADPTTLLRAQKSTMQLLHSTQPIVLKGFFLILCFAVCASFSLPARAATLTADQIAQLTKSGNVTGAASALSSQSGLSLSNATKLIQSLQGGKIDIGSATNLISGALGGQTVNAGNLTNITQMLQGLQNGQATPAAISGLISKVAGGALPPELGKALGAIGQLGNLTNINSIADVFKNPAAIKTITDALGKAGLPADATKALGAIGSITQLVSNPQALLQNPTALAGAIQNVLKAVAPNLAKQLESLTGGLTKALTSLLGGGQQPPTQPPPTSGGSCGAACNSCRNCVPHIHKNHEAIRAHVTSEFEQHRTWIVSTFFTDHVLPSMQLMTTEFASNMMQQVQAIGSFFDAKQQLETQRLFQQMKAQTNKDYQPSVSMCTIGTNMRSLAASERQTNLGQVAFANRMLQRQTLSGDNISTFGTETDRRSRLDMFIKNFCNKEDHAGGLEKLCASGGTNKKQINMDVDYTSAFENKLTLKLNLTEEGKDEVTDDEENIFALSTNLFGNNVPFPIKSEFMLDAQKNPTAHADWYLDFRSLIAKRSVAQNSFAAITAMKSEGNDEVAPFLKAILLESGVEPTVIEERLGEKPSYFAQMEVMTKDLYQNPTFYANLYDKPVNIERKAVALQAIELMQDRDIYKSLLRSEAVLATLVETMLAEEQANVSRNLDNITLFSERRAGGE